MDYLFADRMHQLIATVPTDIVDGLCISSDDEIVTINGSRTLTLELTYSADTVLLAAKTGAIGNLVMYKDEYNNPVVMEIVKSVRDPLNYTYTLSADTAGADLIDETVDTYDADDEYTIDYYVDKFTWDSGWEIRLNQVTEKALKLKYDNEDETALARVLNVASDFGAELDFAFTIDTDHTVHKYIDIYAARGSQTNAELVRDINVNNVTSTTDIYDMFTSLKAKSDVNDKDGNPITLKGMTWQSDDGRYVLGSDGILRDTVAVHKWSRILSEDNPDPSTHHLQRVKKYTTGLDTASDDNPKYKQYPDKVEAKNKDIASQKKKITATDAYIKSQNGYIAKKQKYIAECNARIAAYEKKQKYTYPAKKAAYLAKVKSLQAELAKGGTASHVKSLANQIATQQRLAANQDKYAAKQSKYIAKQQAYIKAANAAIKGYKKKIADYNAKIKGYNATIDKDKKAIADLNAGKVALYNDVQSKTLDLALADLKAHNEPAVNYETDIALLPDTVRLGDTVHIVDDEEGTYLSSRVLQIETSRVTGTRVATMGNYLIEQRQVENYNAAIQAVFAGMSLSTYPWTRYADDDQGTGISALPTGKSYMATVWGKTAVASDDPADYADHWALIKGEDGAAGTPGPAGADGRTPYAHIAWAQSVDGKTGFSTTSADRATYLGTCSDFTEADPTDPTAYTWAYFQGPQGVAGKDGVGIKSTQIMYAQSTSGTTAPTTGWTAQVPTLIKGQYLWTQTTWVYTDNTGEAGYTVSYNAKDGNTGANGIAGKDGVGITATAVTYQSSTSGMTAPTGTWVANPPSVAGGNYLWTRTVWSYTDGTSETGYSVAKAGEKGERGKQIFKSKYEGNPNQAGRYWSDLSPAPSVDNPPKIGDTVITPAGNIFQINAVTVGGGSGSFGVGDVLGNIKGDTGKDGLPGKDGVGITATAVTYQSSTSGMTAPTGTWVANPPSVAGGNYLWTRTIWTYTDGTSETGYSVAKAGEKGDKGDQGLQGLQGPKGDQGIAGPKGTDGKTQYTHIAYANSADGVTNFTVSDSNRTYIGMYVDFTSTDSTKPSDYSWTLVKGANGANGTPGKPGADGRTPYFHIAYADSADGKDGFYVGGGTNLLTGTSSSEQSYTSDFSTVPGWGTAFVAVNAGSTYTYSIYLTRLTGSFVFGYWGYDNNKKYVNWFPSDNYSSLGKVSWTFTVPSGVSYIVPHVVRNSDGFTCTAKEEKLELGTIATPWSPAPSEAHPIYMGTYTDYTQADSLDPTAYLWSQIKGEKGDQGDRGLQGLQGLQGPQGNQGIQGPDGKPSYTHIAYGTSSTGAGFTQTPSASTTYIGMYVDFTSTDSNNPTKYAWSLIKGADGADGTPGKPGADGKTPYFHTAWATADGGTSGFSTTDSAGKSYLGVYTDYNQADSTTASSYSWSLIKGPQGIKGDTGATGPTGPKGDSGAPGSKDVPMTYVQATQPTGSIVKDSTWWVGDSMKTATALKRWDGSTWVPDTIAQAVLNIIELNAITINGSVFNGSTFNSTFEKVRPDGAAFTVYGTSTLENGALATTTYRDSDNSLYTTTQVNPVDIGSASYYGGTKVDEALLKEGQLYLGTLYKDSASSDPYWEAGTITADQLLMMQRCGSVLWTGVNSMNSKQTITPNVSINKCLTGWLLTWQEYRNGAVTGAGIVNTPLYKNDVIAHSGAGFPLGFVNYDQNAVVKYVYPTTTQIKGNDRNGSLDYSKGFVLTKVTAF